MKAELVTKSEYARMRGVQPSAVTKAINDGRITLVGEKIDPAVADIQWAQNTRARVGSSPQQGRQQRPTAPDREPASKGDESGYWASRSRREEAEAQLAELKLQEQLGELVRRDAVNAAYARRIGELSSMLDQIAPRCAPLLAPEADQRKCAAILESEVRRIKDAISGASHGGA